MFPKGKVCNHFWKSAVSLIAGTSALLLMVLYEPTYAGLVEDAAQIVAEAGRNQRSIDPENRLLALVIAHPTESVLLQAANWPWEYGGFSLVEFLAPWVLRSPKLREVFRRNLSSPLEQTRRVAVKLLAPLVSSDTDIHNAFRRIAAQGDEIAISALVRLASIDLADCEVLLKYVANHDMPVNKKYGPMLYLTRLIPTVPEVRSYFLDRLKSSRDSTEIGILADLLSQWMTDPEIEKEARTTLARVSGQISAIEAQINLLRAILSLHPQDEECIRLLGNLVIQSGKDIANPNSDGWNVFNLAKKYLGRDQNLDQAIDSAMNEVIRTFGRIRAQNFEAMSIGSFFDLYIFAHKTIGPFELNTIKAFMKASPPDNHVREEIYATLVKEADKFPPEARPLLIEAENAIDAPTAASHLAVRERPSSSILRIAARGLNSQDQLVFEKSVDLLATASRFDPKYAGLLKDFVSQGPPWKAKAARVALLSANPGAIEAGTSAPPSQRAQAQRQLITDENPSTGWRQVVQSLAISFDSDPFLFDEGIDSELLKEIQAGKAARTKRLEAGEDELNDEGMLTRPNAWVKEQLEQRQKIIRTQLYDLKLSVAQRRQIQVDAGNRMRTEYSGLKETDPEYGPVFHRIVLELEWSAKNKGGSLQRISQEWFTDSSRELMTNSIQEVFRKSLVSIIKGHLGKVLAFQDGDEDPEKTHVLSESDVADMKLIAEPTSPPYNVDIEWRGRKYGLGFKSRSLDGISLRGYDYKIQEASEVAPLTLGPLNANANETAREVYLGRTFNKWLGNFQLVLSTIERTGSARVMSEISNTEKMEETTINKALYPGGNFEAVSSILWNHVDKTPDYWKRREIAAINRGDADWEIIIPSRSGVPLASLLKEFGNPSKNKEAKGSNDPIDGAKLRVESANREIPEDDTIFRIQKVRNESQIPEKFWRGYVDHFDRSAPSKELSDIPFDAGKSEFLLQSEKTITVVDKLVSIPRPYTEKQNYDLSALQLFSAQGDRLYPGRDYKILENTKNRSIAIQVLNSRVSEVRMVAGFKVGAARTPPDMLRLSTDGIRKTCALLEEAGFQDLAHRIRQAANEAHAYTMGLDKLVPLFLENATYATGKESDLGAITAKSNIPATNPFKRLAEKYLNPQGRICTQCTGASDIGEAFLRAVLGNESGLHIEVTSLLRRDPGSMVLTRIGHATVVIYHPDFADPIEVDFTPRRPQAGNPIAAVGPTVTVRAMNTQEPLEDNKVEEPAWVSLLEDQVPEPDRIISAPMEPEPEIRTTSVRDEITRRLREHIEAMDDTVVQERKKGRVPEERALQSDEPLKRVRSLARVADDLLSGKISVDDARTSLGRIDRRFQEQSLNSEPEVLTAIATFAQQDRGRYEKYMLRTGAKNREYYRNPFIQDQMLLLYRSLESLPAVYEDPVAACVIRVMNGLMHER